MLSLETHHFAHRIEVAVCIIARSRTHPCRRVLGARRHRPSILLGTRRLGTGCGCIPLTNLHTACTLSIASLHRLVGFFRNHSLSVGVYGFDILLLIVHFRRELAFVKRTAHRVRSNLHSLSSVFWVRIVGKIWHIGYSTVKRVVRWQLGSHV